MSQPGDPPDLAPAPPPGEQTLDGERAPGWTWPEQQPAGGLADGPRAEFVPALVAAAAVAALGAPFGLLWSVLAPDVPVRVTARGPTYAEAQPEQLIAADGWFALLAVPFGILLAAGVWLVARRIRGLPGLAGVTAGAVGAGLLAWVVGRQIGLAGYRETLASAEPGTVLYRPPDLAAVELGWWPPHVLGVVLVPALVAAVTYTLLAAWSAYPSLRPDDPEPEHSFDDLGVS